MKYKALVRSHVETLMTAGMSRDTIAANLSVQSNFLTMILSDRYPKATLPLQRIPLLCSLCGLTGTEALRLVRRLTETGANRGVHFSQETFDWLLQCAALGLKEHRRGC